MLSRTLEVKDGWGALPGRMETAYWVTVVLRTKLSESCDLTSSEAHQGLLLFKYVLLPFVFSSVQAVLGGLGCP